jgi:hypothetical protein
MKICVSIFAAAVLAAGVMLFGCSEKIVNQNDASAVNVRISAPAALMAGLARFARIVVTAPDMTTMNVPLALDSTLNQWTGSLSVPSGIERVFTLEAVDTSYGEGSYPSTEYLLYTASDTVDLVANHTDTVNFELFPVIPLLTTSPSLVRRNYGDTFTLTVGMYHVPSNLYQMLFRVYYPLSLVVVDSVTFDFPAADSLVLFGQNDRANGFVAFTLSETNASQALFSGSRYVPVAKMHCRMLSGSNFFSGLVWVEYPSMYDASQQSIILDDFRAGWSDIWVNPAGQ